MIKDQTHRRAVSNTDLPNYFSCQGIKCYYIPNIILDIAFVTYDYRRFLYLKIIKESPFNLKLVNVILCYYSLITIPGTVYIVINLNPVILILLLSASITFDEYRRNRFNN